MKKLFLSLMVACAVLGTLFVSCSPSTGAGATEQDKQKDGLDTRVIGTWEYQEQGITFMELTLESDKTFVLTMVTETNGSNNITGTSTMKGTYTTSNNSINASITKISFNNSAFQDTAQNEVFLYTITSTKLSLTYKGQTSVLTKK